MASLKKVENAETTATQNVVETAQTAVDNENVFEFLAGYVDKDGVVHKEFELREMTGRDEEIIRKADAQKNASKAIRELLCRCFVRIGTYDFKVIPQPKREEIVKNLLVYDQDYALMQLRKISLGGELTTEHVCPNSDCKAKIETIFDIDELEITEWDGERVIPFELNKGYTDREGVVHKTGTMRHPNGLDREILTPLANTNPAKATTTMLTRICKFDSGLAITEDIMASLVVKDRKYLNDLLNEHSFGYKLTVDVSCDQCGTAFEGSLNTSNFI